jgi:hypothetical protein
MYSVDTTIYGSMLPCIIWHKIKRKEPVTISLKIKKIKRKGSHSVADPGCLSRIPDPDFFPSRISDPGSKNSNERQG